MLCAQIPVVYVAKPRAQMTVAVLQRQTDRDEIGRERSEQLPDVDGGPDRSVQLSGVDVGVAMSEQLSGVGGRLGSNELRSDSGEDLS